MKRNTHASALSGPRIPKWRSYFTRLWHHKLLILLILAALLLLAFAYLRYTPPKYQSDASLRLKQGVRLETSQDKLPLSRVILQHHALPTADPIETEIKVMRSRTFMLQLANTLYDERYDPKGGVFPVLQRDYPTDPNLRSPVQIAEYLSEQLHIERLGTASGMIQFRYRSPSPDEAFTVVQTAMRQYVASLKGEPDSNDERERSRLRRQIDSLQQAIAGASSTTAVGKMQVDMNLRRLTQALTALQAEKRAANMRSGILRDMIAENQQEQQAIQPGRNLQAIAFVSPKLSRLQEELSKAEIQKMLYLAESPNILPQDPYLIEINDSIVRLQRNIADYAAEIMNTVQQVEEADQRYTQAQEKQIKTLQQQRLSYEIEQSHLNDRIKALDREIAGYQGQLQQLPEQQARWVRAESEQQTNNALRITLEDNLAALNRAPQPTRLQADIVDPAYRPEVGVEPEPQKVYGFALVSGLLLSLLYVGFRPIWQTRVDSIEGLNRRGWNVLALIPDHAYEWVDGRLRKRKTENVAKRAWMQMRESPDLIMATDFTSRLAEPYRRLEANIRFSKEGDQIKTIAITSPGRGEGKSVLAANLALAFAETGKEVVLVDLNFRQPAVHTLFGIDRSPGLQDWMQATTSIDTALRRTPLPNLKLLTVGSVVTGLKDISRNDLILQALNELKTRFDMVLIDTPAFGRYADAAGALATADSVLICTRFLQTPWAELDILKKNLNDIHAEVSGVVITAFDPRKAKQSYHTSQYFKQNYLTKTYL
jgi:tyrosine-protein kinase Etk/Wzc